MAAPPFPAQTAADVRAERSIASRTHRCPSWACLRNWIRSWDLGPQFLRTIRENFSQSGGVYTHCFFSSS